MAVLAALEKTLEFPGVAPSPPVGGLRKLAALETPGGLQKTRVQLAALALFPSLLATVQPRGSAKLPPSTRNGPPPSIANATA